MLNDGKVFDQFAGKGPSSYSDSLYSTELKMDKIGKSTIKKGLDLEKEINSL